MSCKIRKCGELRMMGPRRNRARAFTLVELMVVVVILGLLATAAVVSVRSYLITSKQNIAKMEIAKISQAIDAFYSQFDRFPTTNEGIRVLTEKSDKFPEGLLTATPVDPWGQEYEYVCPASDAPFEIITFGADKREGGTGADADISSSTMVRKQ
jgi:general secretion pathway protein G